RPAGKNIVSTKWVFKRKLRADNTIDKYRARWVARGFTQRYGQDYDDTYAPVLAYSSMRLILAMAANYGWDIFQTDVPVAFLHSPMDYELYASQPEGYVDPAFPDHVCLFQQCLYGFKQSANRWNATIHTYFISRGYVCLSADACLYALWREGDRPGTTYASEPEGAINTSSESSASDSASA